MIPLIRPAVKNARDGLMRVMLDAFKASYAAFMPREHIASGHAKDTARAS